MKKIIFFVTCFLFLVPIALADYEVANYQVDITVLENGNLNIIEALQMKGIYNGYERKIKYRNNYQGYKGDILASIDKNLYNGNGLKLNEVRAINYSNEIDIVEYKETGDLFKLVDEAKKGNHSVYTISNITDGQIYKIYNPSRMNKDFYFDYTLENMVINHQDVAEVAMYLFDNLEEDINNIVIAIHIPLNNDNLKVWTHGGEDVKIKYVDEETITINVGKIKKDTTFDLRFIFDNDVVLTKKTTDELVLDKIEKLEANLDLDVIDPVDEEYNKTRDDAYNSVVNVENSYNRDEYNNALEKVSNLKATDELRTELLIRLMNVEPKIERREEILKVILTSVITLWLIGLIIILYQIYKKYNYQVNEKKFKIDKNIEPFKIGYLLKKKVTKYDLASSLLYLIEKKLLDFDEKRRTLKKNKVTNLKLASEEKIIKMLFNDKNKITLEDISYYVQENFDEFLKDYSNWLNFATVEAEDEHYHENLLFFKIFGVVYCVGGILLGSFLIGNDVYYSPITIIVLAGLFLFYFIFFKKRTYDGLVEFLKYVKLKKQLIKGDISNLNDIPYYLMYANSMGCFNKFSKRLDNYEVDKFRAKTIRDTIILIIKQAYEARNNAHAKYASVKIK